MSKKTLCIDMDDTIADFTGHPKIPPGVTYDVSAMYEPGFFLSLKVLPGALSAVRRLMAMGYDVHILSKPVYGSAHCYSEKVQWVALNFPELVGKIMFVQDKGFVKADYLIDDSAEQWQTKFEANGGKFIEFPYSRKNPTSWDKTAENWHKIADFLENELRKTDGSSN